MITARKTGRFLPLPNQETPTGAACGNGWLLCWTHNEAFAWSPNKGWIALPVAPGTITAAGRMNSGIAVVVGSQNRIGFWAYGERRWRWWASLDLPSTRWFFILPKNIVIEHAQGSDTEIRWFAPTEAFGLRPVAAISSSRLGETVAPWHGESDSHFGIVTFQGIFVTVTTKNTHVLRCVHRHDIPFKYSQLEVTHTARYCYIHNPGVVRLDTATLELQPLFLPPIKGLDVLWECHADGNRELVRRVLNSASHAALQGRFPVEFLATCVWGGTEPILATNEGIWLPEEGACSASPQATWNPFVSDHYAELLTWRLWLENGEHSGKTLDALLVWSDSDAEMIADALAHYCGDDSFRHLLEHARLHAHPKRFSSRLDGPRQLATRLGRRIKPMVRRGLQDSNDAVATVAAAAAAALRADGKPLLWRSSGEPRRLLATLLHRQDAHLQEVVLQTLELLRPRGVAEDVAPFLDSETSSLRSQALRTLAQLPDLHADLRNRMRTIAFTDPESEQRRVALEAATRVQPARARIRSLISALGDEAGYNRSWSAYLLFRHVKKMKLPDLLRVVDLACLELMAFRTRPFTEPSDWPVLFFRDSTHFFLFSPDTGIRAYLPEVRFAAAAAMVNLFISKAYCKTCEEEETTLDILRRRRSVDRLIRFGAIDAAYRESLQQEEAPPLELLVRQLPKAACIHPRLPSRLAILTLFTLRHDRDVNDQPRDSLPGQGPPPREGHPSTSQNEESSLLCKRLVRRQSQRAGVEGLAALFVLGLHNEAWATAALRERVLAGELDGCNMLVESMFLLLPKSQWRDFASDVLASRSITVNVRWHLCKAWDDDQFGPLPTIIQQQLYREVIGSGKFPFDDRIQAARWLADIGGENRLSELWEALARHRTLDENERYARACDLAASGRGEYLDEVRKEWIRREDAAALRAFRASGQLSDIPELEWAIAAGAPEQPIRETIEVIQRRYGLIDDSDVPGEGH